MQNIPGDLLTIDRKRRAHSPTLIEFYRSAEERVCDFDEALLPMLPHQAIYEASRCIHCPDPAPCVRACPVHNDIPSALWLIEQARFIEAADLYRQTSVLPEICGRVCPKDKMCQNSCVQGKHNDPIPTGALEVFVTEYQRHLGDLNIEVAESIGKKVAVVGAGPSGLACAYQLARKGYSVTMFDAKPYPGGLMMYGIPSFKLDKHIVEAVIEDLFHMGVNFVGSTFVGKDITIDELFRRDFGAVYLAVGTWIDANMEIPGEDLPGVYKGTDFLIRSNVDWQYLPKNETQKPDLGKKVVVIGGGDSAADCLRTALRMGAEEITCLYRRTENEMPGGEVDRKLAREEGAQFQFLTQPVRFIPGKGKRLAAVECVRMELGEPGRDGRRRPVPIEDSNFFVEADTAILALGYWPDETISKATPGLQTHIWGLIVTDPETGATSRPGIFAGGDAVTGPDLVVTAMKAGQDAADSIHAYLRVKMN